MKKKLVALLLSLNSCHFSKGLETTVTLSFLFYLLTLCKVRISIIFPPWIITTGSWQLCDYNRLLRGEIDLRESRSLEFVQLYDVIDMNLRTLWTHSTCCRKAYWNPSPGTSVLGCSVSPLWKHRGRRGSRSTPSCRTPVKVITEGTTPNYRNKTRQVQVIPPGAGSRQEIPCKDPDYLFGCFNGLPCFVLLWRLQFLQQQW